MLPFVPAVFWYFTLVHLEKKHQCNSGDNRRRVPVTLIVSSVLLLIVGWCYMEDAAHRWPNYAFVYAGVMSFSFCTLSTVPAWRSVNWSIERGEVRKTLVGSWAVCFLVSPAIEWFMYPLILENDRYRAIEQYFTEHPNRSSFIVSAGFVQEFYRRSSGGDLRVKYLSTDSLAKPQWREEVFAVESKVLAYHFPPEGPSVGTVVAFTCDQQQNSRKLIGLSPFNVLLKTRPRASK